MSYAIVLLPEKHLKEMVQDFWRTLEKQEISNYHLEEDKFPHITFYSFDTKDLEQKVKEDFEKVYQEFPILPLRITAYNSFGVGKAFFLKPTFSNEFFNYRMDYLNRIESWTDNSNFTYYPHVTVTNHLSSVAHNLALDYLAQNFYTLSSNYIGLSLLSFDVDGHVKRLKDLWLDIV